MRSEGVRRVRRVCGVRSAGQVQEVSMCRVWSRGVMAYATVRQSACVCGA